MPKNTKLRITGDEYEYYDLLKKNIVDSEEVPDNVRKKVEDLLQDNKNLFDGLQKFTRNEVLAVSNAKVLQDIKLQVTGNEEKESEVVDYISGDDIPRDIHSSIIHLMGENRQLASELGLELTPGVVKGAVASAVQGLRDRDSERQ